LKQLQSRETLLQELNPLLVDTLLDGSLGVDNEVFVSNSDNRLQARSFLSRHERVVDFTGVELLLVVHLQLALEQSVLHASEELYRCLLDLLEVFVFFCVAVKL
jgi:hypothetical protein